MPSAKVKKYLDEAGVEYKLIEHDTVYTAQEIAAVTHVKGKELIKAIIIKAGADMIMAAIPSTKMVDFDLLEKFLEKDELNLAKETDFCELFPDCAIGAMPPLGHLYNVKVIADKSITEDKDIVFNAGTHHDIIKISLDDFIKLEHPRIAQITTPI
jgi:Ala-tRNA(Pro) deacylase